MLDELKRNIVNERARDLVQVYVETGESLDTIEERLGRFMREDDLPLLDACTQYQYAKELLELQIRGPELEACPVVEGIGKEVPFKIIVKKDGGNKTNRQIKAMVGNALMDFDCGTEIEEIIKEKLDYDRIASRVKDFILENLSVNSIINDMLDRVEDDVVDMIVRQIEVDDLIDSVDTDFEVTESFANDIAEDLNFY